MFELFGRYRLLRLIATGGMAEIFLAQLDGEAGQEAPGAPRLVVKRLLPELGHNDQFVRMFLDEARIAARLNHPNIVQIFDLGSVGEAYFIAMEYLHGADARRVWRQADAVGRPLPPDLACRIAIGAAAGLHCAHNKTSDLGAPLGIVHRDVSPQNLIVTFGGEVKVVDFGIAKAADQTEVTRSGVVKGKFSYMSPEQAAGKRVDHRTDQFALGIVLHELLTGERLFKRKTDLETARAVEECDVPLPSAVSPRVPSSLDPIVLRALAPNAEDRFRDCMALQVALEEWLESHTPVGGYGHLSSFMGDIYRRHLEQDRRVAKPWWETSTQDADSLGSGPPRQFQVDEDDASESSGTHRIPPPRSIAAIDGPSEATTRPDLTTLHSAPGRGRAGKQRWVLAGALIAAATAFAGFRVGLAALHRGPGEGKEVGLEAGDGGAGIAGPVELSTPDAGPPPRLATGSVRVMTLPLGALVTVDGRTVGRSPVDPIDLPIGMKTEIAASLEGFQDARTTWLVGEGEGVVQLSLEPKAPIRSGPRSSSKRSTH